MKTGKKAGIFIVILGLMIALSACDAGKEDRSDSPYIGTWTATTGTYADMSVEIEGTYTITLNADGVANIVTDDRNESCKWEENDTGVTLKKSGEVTMVEDGNGGLTIEQEGVVISFVRQSG